MQSVLLLSMTSLCKTCRAGWICRAHPSQRFPPANPCRGCNVVTIPLSLKARLCLQEGKAKGNLCKEPTVSYPQCIFCTVVVILFSFTFPGGHRAAVTHMHDGANQDTGFVTRPQQSNSNPPVCVVLPCAVSPGLHPMWPNPALEQFMPSSRKPVLGPPVPLGGPGNARWTHPWHEQCESSASDADIKLSPQEPSCCHLHLR